MKYIIILAVIFISSLCLCSCKGCIKNDRYEIKFIIDGEIYSNVYADNGAKINEPITPEKSGYVFNGWYKTDKYEDKWDFNSEIVSDNLSLYGYWDIDSAVRFKVNFYDGTELLQEINVIKGSNIEHVSCTPATKIGYSFVGWFSNDKIYDFSLPIDKDINLTAKWEINRFSVTFIADGNVVDVCTYSIVNKEIILPPIPEKQHYNAEWEEFDLTYTLGNIEVIAIYTPVIYTATFLVDNKIYKEIKYTIEDEITIPKIPEKTGYISSWSDLEIDGGNIIVTAEYTLIIYTATFMADEKIISCTNYTVEDNEITVPPVPEIVGYSGTWEDFEFTTGDIIINAEYKITNYSATFVADGVTVAVMYFNIENKRIIEPEIPSKNGFTANWEDYSIELKDIVIKAVYTPVN